MRYASFPLSFLKPYYKADNKHKFSHCFSWSLKMKKSREVESHQRKSTVKGKNKKKQKTTHDET